METFYPFLSFFPILSLLVGVIGTLLAGSTSLSNVIFGPVQMQAAQSPEFPLEVILGLLGSLL